MSDHIDYAAFEESFRRALDHIRDAVQSNWDDPRAAKQISKRHRERHDHTDTAMRCTECGRFLPQAPGHNRAMCDCGTPNSYWVEP